jgi:hypothetical protein
MYGTLVNAPAATRSPAVKHNRPLSDNFENKDIFGFLLGTARVGDRRYNYSPLQFLWVSPQFFYI